MLSAVIKIRSIDYEYTFQQIFPALSEKITSLTSKNMIIRLFQQLGDTALPVLIGLMQRIPEDTKNELLVCGLNACAPELRDKLNAELMKDEWGRLFEIGTFFIEQRTEIFLDIRQIKVDYQALLNNDRVNGMINRRLGKWSSSLKAVAKMAIDLTPNTIERKGLELLSRKENHIRLMNLLMRVLSTHGVKLEMSEIQLMQEENMPENATISSQPFALTEKMENDIISALADYLRSNISNELRNFNEIT